MIVNDKFDEKRKLVLAGAGECGQRWLEWLWDEGRDILCFADGDKRKLGKELLGKKIIGYNELKDIDDDIDIFITVVNERAEKEIKTMLLELGFNGRILEHPLYRDCKLSKSSYTKNSYLEGKNLLYDGARLMDSYLGCCSYLGQGAAIVQAKVGRYTCIGPQVRIITGQHPISDMVSVHPAFYSINHIIGYSYVKENKFVETRKAEQNYAVVIGNDVWIGMDARIMEGVTIADGSVIAAGAVVVKNTEPYEVVGGIPAQHIKYRFEKEEREKLLKIQWWNKDLEWIKKHAEEFSNIRKFLKSVSS